MTHPITPPPELVQEWAHLFIDHTDTEVFSAVAQWGADQELEACCTELDEINCQKYWSERLRTARRPKPSSLKKQALAVLESVAVHELYGNATADNRLSADDMRTIRCAIEALPE
jgi:hypothetical protein